MHNKVEFPIVRNVHEVLGQCSLFVLFVLECCNDGGDGAFQLLKSLLHKVFN